MTTYLTIDSGIAYRLIAPHPKRPKYTTLVTGWQRSGFQLCAPVLWAYEVASIFTKMVHFGELSELDGREGLQLAYELGVQLFPPDESQSIKAFEWTRRLRRVAAYDSFYLALAESIGCEFWTIDKRLVNAAGQSWVKLVEV